LKREKLVLPTRDAATRRIFPGQRETNLGLVAVDVDIIDVGFNTRKERVSKHCDKTRLVFSLDRGVLASDFSIVCRGREKATKSKKHVLSRAKKAGGNPDAKRRKKNISRDLHRVKGK